MAVFPLVFVTLPFFLVLLESFAPTATAPKRTKPVTVEAPAPEVHELEWAEPLRRCGRRGRRRFCDGPRRVPLAWGEAAERAKRLGLGDTHAYNVLATRGPWDELLAEVEHDAEDTLLWPVPEGTMGRGFGYVRRQALANRLHKGVDIPAAEGSDVRAANAGIVAYADNGIVGYGNMIVLVHKNRTSTVYAHLSEARVFAGQQVERGETIGRIGRTGLTYAPHLHFEWRRGARPRNPLRRFVDRPSRERAYQLQLAMQRRRQAARRERLAARSR